MALTASVRRAVPSFRGLALTVVIDEQPVSVTSAERGNVSDIATSLRLSLAWVTLLGPDSQITFYASAPGTFVDLAADLAHALGSESLYLDGDIPVALISRPHPRRRPAQAAAYRGYRKHQHPPGRRGRDRESVEQRLGSIPVIRSALLIANGSGAATRRS